jgi:phosphopantetheine adenylyltransferase
MKFVLDSSDLDQYQVLGHIEDGNGNLLFDKEWGIIVSSAETLKLPMKNRLRGVSKYTIQILLQCAVKVVCG